MFFKVGVLENSAIFKGKHLCKPTTLSKGNSDSVASCAYCKIFKNSFSYRTPAVATSDISRYETGIVELRKQRIEERLNGC